MSRRFVMFLVALLGAVLAQGRADDTKEFKSFIGNVTPKMAAAYKTGNWKFFDQLFSADFKTKDGRGVTMGRKEAMFVLRYQLNTIKLTDVKAQTTRVVSASGKCVASTTCKMIGLTQAVQGRPSQKIEVIRRFNDTYEKRGKSWLLIYREDAVQPLIKLQPLSPAKKS